MPYGLSNDSFSQQFITGVKETVARLNMLKPDDYVVLGLSGGADSVSLLHTLLALGFRLAAVHVNHGIRGAEAEADERFVEGLCEGLGVPLKVSRIDIPLAASASGQSEEEAGRAARYEAFHEALRELGADKIAVAHNSDDNAETVLFNLLRGAGMKGLCGIPAVRGSVVRPLINTPRENIEEFLRKNGWAFRTDATNAEAVYTRNKLRLGLLPYIRREINPGVSAALNRTAEILAAENAYLEQAAEECYRQCAADGGLLITALNKYPVAMRRRAVRMALAAVSPSLKDISYAHIDMALRLACTGKAAELPGGVRVECGYGVLRFSVPSGEEDGLREPFVYELKPGGTVYVRHLGIHACAYLYTRGSTAGGFNREAITDGNSWTAVRSFDYDRVKGKVLLRSREPGDRIYIGGLGGHKKLKAYFIDEKIPREQRNNIPLVADESGVIWIADKKSVTDSRYRADDATRSVLTVALWKDGIAMTEQEDFHDRDSQSAHIGGRNRKKSGRAGRANNDGL